MRKLDHFDLIAPYYERFIRSHDANRLVELLGLPRDGYVLDAGGGTGRLSQYYPGRDGHVVIADFSMPMLIASKNKTSLRQVCSPSERLPFMSNSFDAISMIDALHHVFDQRQTCAELWRVLKPGGRIVIDEPDLSKNAVKILALAEKLLLMRTHIVMPEEIASFYSGMSNSVKIVREGYIGWVIIEKP